jgi:anti-repressor protein
MNLNSYNFNGFNIRILLADKEYFIAKDLAETLGYSNPNEAVSDHCKKTTNIKNILTNSNSLPLDKTQLEPYRKMFGNSWKQVKLIPESDVWRLIIKSRLPEAEKIEEWIMEEVLPSIRKTGSYSIEKVEATPEISLSEIIEQTEKAVEVIKLLENKSAFELFQIDRITGKFSPTKLLEIDFSQKYFLPTELGFLKGISGAEMNQFLEQKGFQIRENEKWLLTEKGKDFGVEIGGKFSQLKWKLEILK